MLLKQVASMLISALLIASPVPLQKTLVGQGLCWPSSKVQAWGIKDGSVRVDPAALQGYGGHPKQQINDGEYWK